MNVFRNNWNLLLFNFFLSALIFFTFAPEHNLKHIINAIFYVGFSYFTFYLLLLVMKERFFDGITFGFRRFRALWSKDPDSLLEEWKEKRLPSEIVSEAFYKKIRFQGLFFLIIMIILLIIYYMF